MNRSLLNPRLSRREFIAASAVGALALGGRAYPRDTADGLGTPKRVIFIILDSLRADHLGCYGYGKATSPWLDAFAEQCVQFERCLSPSHGTMVSTPGFMTGLFATHLFRNTFDHHAVPTGVPKMAEMFKGQGFRTLWWTTNGFSGRKFGYGPGVDEFYEIYPRATAYASIDEIVEHMQEHYEPSGGPEFIYVHTNDIHYPYRPPIPFDREFGPGNTRGVAKEGIILDAKGKYARSVHPYFSELHDATEEDFRFLEGQYDGEIRYTDDRLPQLLEALQFDPKEDLLALSSDHGEQFLEFGFWGHGQHLYPPEFHVPLLLRYEGLTARRVDGAVSNMDLLPTFCEWFGLEGHEHFQGESLLPALDGKPLAGRHVAAEGIDYQGPSGIVMNDRYYYFLSTDYRQILPWATWPYQEGLFDLQEDYACQNNLVGDAPEIANGMNEALREVHPRYRNFTPEKIRKTVEPKAGPNLIVRSDANMDAWRLSKLLEQSVDENESLHLTARKPVIRLTAQTTEHDRRAYVFDLDYTLESGWIRILIGHDEPKRVLWDYQIRKAKPDGGRHRVVCYPKAPEAYVEIRVEEPGRMRLSWPSLRLLNTPYYNCWTRPLDLDVEEVETPEMTDEEKARLEALGYLQ